MRSRILKFTFATMHTSLGHPLAPLGMNDRCIHYRVDEIPDDVSDADLIQVFSQTCDVTWLSKEPGAGRHVFKFEELRPGRIIFE